MDGQRFDVTLEFKHNEHPGRRQFGVPPKVRRWIRENPRSNPVQQREDLQRVLKKGEIEGVDREIFLLRKFITGGEKVLQGRHTFQMIHGSIASIFSNNIQR
jgi:hypothetical protein